MTHIPKRLSGIYTNFPKINEKKHSLVDSYD